jgi:RNA polymerase sigma factor (sigma-70 family)
MNGTELLAEFRASRTEAAFDELVRRYTNLVYSIARRRVNDAALAQEVTQIVFIRTAKTPPKLSSEAQLLAWLHRTTVHVSIDLWRSETRRHAREQLVMAMPTDRPEEAAWKVMTPVLDEALDGLHETDRQAILLRFFDQKSMAELGKALGVTEDAAKMRVSRAIERLRTQLGGLGVTCGTLLLETLLFERSVEAAPPSLAPALIGAQNAGTSRIDPGTIGSPSSGLTPAIPLAS